MPPPRPHARPRAADQTTRRSRAPRRGRAIRRSGRRTRRAGRAGMRQPRIHSSVRTMYCSRLGPPSRADDRALAHDGTQRQRHEQVVAALAGGRDAALLQDGEQLFARQTIAAGQRAATQALGLLELIAVDRLDPVHSGGGAMLPIRGERQHPGEVARGNDVDRAAHRPRAHDLAAVESRVDVAHAGVAPGASGQRPPAAPELLALRGEHVRLGGRGDASAPAPTAVRAESPLDHPCRRSTGSFVAARRGHVHPTARGTWAERSGERVGRERVLGLQVLVDALGAALAAEARHASSRRTGRRRSRRRRR